MDDGTWGFLMTPERLDNETPPEAILAVLRVLHKNLSSSFDLFSLGSKMGPGGPLLFRWREAKLLSVCHLFYLYALFLTDRPLLPHAKKKKKIFHLAVKTRHIRLPLQPAVLQLRSPQQIKCRSSKFDWDFVWPLNWMDRARAWLQANTAPNGELENGGSINPLVTFTQLA